MVAGRHSGSVTSIPRALPEAGREIEDDGTATGGETVHSRACNCWRALWRWPAGACVHHNYDRRRERRRRASHLKNVVETRQEMLLLVENEQRER